MPERVFVAMSGGVDSSVSAHLLKEAGYAVSGVHLELSPEPSGNPETEHADLERTCELLNIPLVYVHMENEFERGVIDYFCREYSLGRTPNPCVRCNLQIKFGLLLDRVREMRGQYLATGHYARVEKNGAEYRLLKGTDPAKDQSYFLYLLGQRELSQVIFPVGAMHKTEVKERAAALGLPAAGRAESQDICFVPGNDSRAFLASHLENRPGDIVDLSGRVLGKHRGLAFYTIGQRQGVGVSSSGPLYVLSLDAGANRLVIGPEAGLFKNDLTAGNLSWVSGRPPADGNAVRAKVRYRSGEAEASLRIEDGIAHVTFREPQKAIAPGQAVVFYLGEVVLGGGTIC
jgi:tRNA-uridine 2-sulfurtransferase